MINKFISVIILYLIVIFLLPLFIFVFIGNTPFIKKI